LSYLYDEFYSKSDNIVTTKEYTIKFLYEKEIDIRATFIANNKKFTCKQIKRTISANGFNKIAEGTFYPVDLRQ
jgi:hypothetical protein